MNKKTIKDINVSGKRVLVRCDFNVPQDENGKITDESRIKGALPTIKYLIENNAKIVLCSHLGRPKGFDERFTLKPVADRLNELLGGIVVMANDVIGDDAKAKVAALKDGHIVLLQNVRFHPEEEKNNPEFAKQLAAFGDIYVNDAFGTAHRAHASTEGVTKYIKDAVAGFLIQKELDIIGGALDNPQRPFVAILGGAKVSDKIGVIRNLLTKVDSILIGGAMANTFLKAMGGNLGKSRVETDKLDLANELLAIAKKNNVEMLFPTDKVCCANFDNISPTSIHPADNIPDDLDGMDIGPVTIKKFVEVVSKSKTVLWNGPMGVSEMSNFAEGTRAIAQALVDNKNCISIIGGGDSAAAAEKMGFGDKVTHISTGGGACLEFLEGIDLPGIACLNNK